MPRAGKRSSVLHKKSKVKKENMELHQKIDELIVNWKAGVATQRQLLVQSLDRWREAELQELHELVVSLPREILDMKVGDYMEKFTPSGQEATSNDMKEEEPTETTSIISKADMLVSTLQPVIEAPVITSKKAAKGKKRKPPTTSRKNAKQAAIASGLVTPTTSGFPPDDSWKNTPFYTPLTRSRVHGEETATPRFATESDLNGMLTKLQLVTARGSPVMIPVDNQRMRARLQEIIRQDLAKVTSDFDTAISSTDSG